jgi:hypothetical protein
LVFYRNIVQIQPHIGEIGLATLYPIKLGRIGDKWFTKETQMVELSLQAKPTIEKVSDKSVIQFRVNYSPTVDFYQLQYKTFSAGLANTLALMKVIVWVFTFITKQYCTVRLHNMFINNNFDYIGSVKAPQEVNPNSLLERDSKDILVERIEVKKKESPGFRINLCQFYCLRVKKCFRIKVSKKEQFYKIAIDNILKTLSVETVLKRSYEVQKLKYCMLTYDERLLLKNTKTVIDSGSFENVDYGNKASQFGYFSIINDDYSLNS